MAKTRTTNRSAEKSKSSLRTLIGRLGAILLIVLMLAVGGFIAWAEFPPAPMPEAISALESDSSVSVDQQQWIEFLPVNQTPTTGFIFYPGGRVDARAYAPTMHQIAAAGYYAVIVPMPLNLAIFTPDRADAVIAAHPEIQHWVIGGHSLGGVMAANYAYEHPNAVQGLALWASYPQASKSLADRQQLQVTSIYGTNDGLTTQADIEASAANLPKLTSFIGITGGNHGQFGWYGEQSGDTPATISREEQQQQVAAAMLTLLQSVK